MSRYMRLSFKNDEGDRAALQLNDFALTDEPSVRTQMTEIARSGVLKGKHGVISQIVGAKIVTTEEQVLF